MSRWTVEVGSLNLITYFAAFKLKCLIINEIVKNRETSSHIIFGQ